ncbi:MULTISPECIES: glutamine amidotransferase [unclassified Corallococcus]|uniref:glutamine amidotransferase n=1 Tax=unclassified Corallococcus TaxID=2685029 RepID=UPI001A8E7692|nr:MULTISPECIES: glutamine amidotransferase [unclassified Corallococcus]MBN9683039.1 theronine dehydrogenase [Corallococcus sp. NCSPR001]WAS85427.1 glutamine amidotransferase [Corallococcus sp. NCRR]
MNSPSFNAWKLVSLSPLPVWALVLLGVGLVLGIALAAWGVRREPSRGRKLLLWGLRLGAGVAAFFFLLEPGIRHLQVARMKNRVAVLVDRSASMNFPSEPGGPTRSAQVAAFLEKAAPTFASWQDRFTVEVYGVDPELSPVTAAQLAQEPARAGTTDLLAALRSAASGGQGSRKLSGVLLFSDGADNAELKAGAVGRARAALTDLGVPVSTFLVGQEALKDLSVEGLKVDDFAFVRNSLTVEVEIHGRGFSGQDIPVVLSQEGKTVASKLVKMTTGDDVKPVSFTFTPDQTGRFVYTVTVPTFPDEAVSDNNSRSFTLKVIRDRVRVLLVVGRPSWDERFLRGLLKQDANVDLVSFYILRTLSDDPGVSNERELSLIPFPMEEIFDTKLHTFDVVIFQNFGYSDPSLSIAEYERNLERYIHEGGAFVMIGGDSVLGEGRASMPTLMEALPVEAAGPANADPFKPRLTPEGLRHPVTSIGTGAASTEGAWGELLPIPGANLTRARPGATVLMDHPFMTVDGKNAPLVSVWDYGRGRAMVVATDATWSWAFTAHRDGSPSRAYDRFWGNALRWLVRDPDLTTLKVTADPPSVEPGRPVGVVVQARMADYQPAEGAQVRVELFSVATRKPVAVQTGTAGADGVVRLEFAPPAPGPYKLLASAKKGETDLGKGEDAVAVRAVGPELSDASVRPTLMEQIASVTEGKAYKLPQDGMPDVPLLDPPVVEVGRAKDQPLWDRWYYLVALIALLGAEWFARRRFGYV